MVKMRIFKCAIIILLFFSSYSFGENRLGPKNLKALIDIGYSKKDAYADDYSKSKACLLYTSPSPRDRSISRMPSSA